MELHGRQIDDSQLAVVREHFTRKLQHPQSKGKLSFDEMLERFVAGQPIAAVAREHGVSRQLMTVFYNQEIRSLIPGHKKGKTRFKMRILREKQSGQYDFSDIAESWVIAIISAAKKYGCTVRRCRLACVSRRRVMPPQNFWKRRFFISGKPCEFHCVSSMTKFSDADMRHYANLALVPEKEPPCDFFVIFQRCGFVTGEDDRILVIPRQVVQNHLTGRRIVQIALPVGKSRYEEVNCRRGWLEYLNRWDLVKA